MSASTDRLLVLALELAASQVRHLLDLEQALQLTRLLVQLRARVGLEPRLAGPAGRVERAAGGATVARLRLVRRDEPGGAA